MAAALALGAAPAFAAWVAVLVTLNLTVNPLVAAATWVGLAVLAAATGRGRLVALSLLVGLGLLVVLPGVAMADGSWRFSFAAGSGWLPESTPFGALMAIGSVLRIPAQVVAAVLLLLVPGEQLLGSLARLSPRSALLGGLAVRLHPLLGRDLQLVRDELESRGRRFDAAAPLGERSRSWAATWNAMIGGACDRAFATAAALEVRGYGAARPTTAAMSHPLVAAAARRSAHIDAAVVGLAASMVAVAVWGRATGRVEAPVVQVFSGVHEPVGRVVLVLALLGFLLGALPAAAVRRARADRGRGSSDAGSQPSGQPSGGVAAAATTSPVRGGAAGSLVLRGVSMTYPGSPTPALDLAELVVAPGSFCVVTGPSGGGKSTLLDVLTGVAPHMTGGRVSGTVSISGRDVSGLRSVERRGLVTAAFQDPERQVVVGRVAEEVAFGMRHRGMDIAHVERRVLEVLGTMDCLHLAHRDCSTLSGGELQRVLLAAALATGADVLVLDEPTSQLDAPSERQFWAAVQRLQREHGTTILASEHRIDHVRDLCDRIVVLDGGRVVTDLRPGEAGARALDTSPYAGLAPRPASPSSPPRLWLAGLTVRLPGGAGRDAVPTAPKTVVRGLDLLAPPGSIITLEGPNGVGKSTLLRAIRGLGPHEGRVVVDGRLVDGVATSARSLAWVSQQAGPVLDARTVVGQAGDAAARLGTGAGTARRALVDAGLDHRAEAHPTELSVGERQRLALIASTSHRPAVWLLDEPTRGMDPTARRWLALQVLAHAAHGGVAVIATHDPALAAALATHRLLLARDAPPRLVSVARAADGTPLAGPVGGAG